MARALLTLLGGVLATILVAVVLTGGRVMPRGFALVLLTIVAGAVVMAITIRRTRQRERAAELAELAALERDTRDDRGHVPGIAASTDTTDEEPDRG
jgi:hypothetical protein